MKLPTIAAIGVFSLGALAAHAASPTVSGKAPIADHAVIAVECEAEAAAFTEVADLAYAFANAGDVFASALFELREQLMDCLVVADDDDRSRPFRGELGAFSDFDARRKI